VVATEIVVPIAGHAVVRPKVTGLVRPKAVVDPSIAGPAPARRRVGPSRIADRGAGRPRRIVADLPSPSLCLQWRDSMCCSWRMTSHLTPWPRP
jgi:hypothetical protein